MTIPSSIKSALKASESIIREYVRKLESQNAKLQKEIAKLQAENVNQKNKTAALEQQLKKGPIHNIKVSFVNHKSETSQLGDDKLKAMTHKKP
jgi:hypothetical protein